MEDYLTIEEIGYVADLTLEYLIFGSIFGDSFINESAFFKDYFMPNQNLLNLIKKIVLLR